MTIPESPDTVSLVIDPHPGSPAPKGISDIIITETVFHKTVNYTICSFITLFKN